MTEQPTQPLPPEPAPPSEQPAPAPEPAPEPAPAPDEPAVTGPAPAPEAPADAAPEPVPAPPLTVADATAGDDPANPLSSVTVHPGVLVRLADVLAHVENWAARHPEIERFLAFELKSNIASAERLNDIGGAAPAGDTQEQVTDTAPEPAPEPAP